MFSKGRSRWQLPLNNVAYTGPIVAPFDLTNISANSPGDPNGIGQLGQPLSISVEYTSPAGTAATMAEVVIDDVAYPMTAVSGNPSKGLTYEFTTSSLLKGDHYFQLEFNDGSGVEDFQEYVFSISPIVLQDSQVTPTSGTSSTEFTFSTVYYGPELPSAVNVVIDGSAYLMTYVTGNPQAGAAYSMTTKLSVGNHSFAFNATSASDSWSDPISPGVYNGLTVTKNQIGSARSTISSRAPNDDPYEYDAG